MTKDELLEKYGELLNNQDYLEIMGIERHGDAYLITAGEHSDEEGKRAFVMLTGTGGVLNYLEALDEACKNFPPDNQPVEK